MSVRKECVLCLDTCTSMDVRPSGMGLYVPCDACFDLQGDALLSMYRRLGSVSVECPHSSGAVLVLRGDDVDEWYLVDQSGMAISWWIQIGGLNSYHLRFWQI